MVGFPPNIMLVKFKFLLILYHRLRKELIFNKKVTMPFIEDFWDEYGEDVVTFIGLDGYKEDLSIDEAHEKLLVLDQNSLELNSNDEFLRNSIEGRINYLVDKFSEDYFDSYKGKDFRVRYRSHNGNDEFSIICISSDGFWGYETEYIDAQYESFKEKIDRGQIK